MKSGAHFLKTFTFSGRLVRMVLMLLLFPLVSLGLCAWMAVFGFYLKLEEREWTR